LNRHDFQDRWVDASKTGRNKYARYGRELQRSGETARTGNSIDENAKIMIGDTG